MKNMRLGNLGLTFGRLWNCLAAAVLIGLAGCGQAPTVETGPVQVIGQPAPDFRLKGPGGTTYTLSEFKGDKNVFLAFYPLAFVAERVGGKRVAVTNLTPTGAEPHDLELTPKQRDAIDEARLVLVLGSDFQPAVEKAAA